MTVDGRGTTTDAVIRIVAALIGLVLVGLGLWAFGSPQSFFDTLATFDPYNAHFIRDIGAFQIGLGSVLVLGAVLPRDGLSVALLGVGIGAVFHAVSHAIDDDLDPALWVLALVLVAVGVVALRRARPGGR